MDGGGGEEEGVVGGGAEAGGGVVVVEFDGGDGGEPVPGDGAEDMFASLDLNQKGDKGRENVKRKQEERERED